MISTFVIDRKEYHFSLIEKIFLPAWTMHPIELRVHIDHQFMNIIADKTITVLNIVYFGSNIIISNRLGPGFINFGCFILLLSLDYNFIDTMNLFVHS